jgi:D-3-phosphoglycerate dehydrogenase
MAKAVLITTSPFGEGDPAALNLLKQNNIRYTLNPFGRRLREIEIADLIEPYEVVIAGTEPITEAVLQRAPRLRLLAHTGIGLDNINLAAARARGIAVTYTPSAPSPAVAELTIGQMISLLRKTHTAASGMQKGQWKRYIGRRLANVTVGIIGVGRVGRLVIRHLQGFKPKRILANDINMIDEFNHLPGFTWTDKDTIFREADIITVHVPLTRQTRKLIGDAELAMMKPDSILINTSRGEIVVGRRITNAAWFFGCNRCV